MNGTTALTRIEAAQKAGALVFVDKDWVTEKTPLFKPEVSEIKLDKENDCFNISGKFMPKREVVDRIGEASGIDFVFGEVRSVTLEDEICGKRTVYTAVAQGRKMMSDGSYRTSSKCDYEFDPVLRAMLDFDVTELTAQTKLKRRRSSKGEEYGPTLAKYILELQKVATQRANTGARLRVIRELVGMPTAFALKDIEKPLYFGRMVQNTEYILKTPEGRSLATAKALGIDISTLFGKPQIAASEPINVTPNDMPPSNETPPADNTAASLAAEAAESTEPEFPDEPTVPGSEQEDLLVQKGLVIEQIMNSYKDALNVVSKNGKNPYNMAQEELANPNATPETRDSMIERLRTWLKAKGINV